MAHLVKHDRLNDGRWQALCDTMQSLPGSELDYPAGIEISLTELREVIVTVLKSMVPDSEPMQTIEQLRGLLMERGGFTWAAIFRSGDANAGLQHLKRVGELLFSTENTEVSRWAAAAKIAETGLREPHFLELLADWTIASLSESTRDEHRFKPERSYLLGLLAGAAMNAPSRFHSMPIQNRLRPLLIRAAGEQNTYVGRADAIRLLGYLRALSFDLLPVLRSALTDVDPVRDAAMEAMALFRRMDPDILLIVQSWLQNESGLVAFATARMLTAIGRHTQIAGRSDPTAAGLRGEIVRILANAIQDSRSRRPLDFGAHTFPTPEVPRLCDFFFDCMLKIAGYEEPVRAGSSQLGKSAATGSSPQ